MPTPVLLQALSSHEDCSRTLADNRPTLNLNAIKIGITYIKVGKTKDLAEYLLWHNFILHDAINKGRIDKDTRRVLHYMDYSWLRDEDGERLALDLAHLPVDRDAVLLRHACGLCDDLPELLGHNIPKDEAGLPKMYFGPATLPPNGWLEVGTHAALFNEEGDNVLEAAFDAMPEKHVVSTHFNLYTISRTYVPCTHNVYSRLCVHYMYTLCIQQDVLQHVTTIKQKAQMPAGYMDRVPSAHHPTSSFVSTPLQLHSRQAGEPDGHQAKHEDADRGGR